MSDDFDKFVESLANEPVKTTQGESRAVQKFPCGQCGGTGRYHGPRVHQEKAHCFACRGLGYFKTDPRKLQQQRQAKVQRQAAEVSAFIMTHVDLVKGLAQVADWNSFAGTMLRQLGLEADLACVLRRIESIQAGVNFKGGKVLTENQVAACERMLAKIAQRDEKRQEEKAAQEAARPVVDLGQIEALFARVMERGAKKPAYYADGIRLSPAPATGVNAGAIYVKDVDGNYLGKVKGSKLSVVFDARSREAEITAKLQAIATDPLEAAIKYGKETGICACCGRELTDPVSIARGIGPICEAKWF